MECVHPDDLPRFAELGVVACMQPRYAAPEIVGERRDNVGPARWPSAFPWRSLHDAGATLAFSSDWNVAEMDPLIGIYTALTRASLDGAERWTPEQRLDLATTIRAYTLGSAYANFAESNRGSITPGKHAALVVLSDDLFALEDPRGILDARVELTVVGGTVGLLGGTLSADGVLAARPSRRHVSTRSVCRVLVHRRPASRGPLPRRSR